jgi:hypothetical protein
MKPTDESHLKDGERVTGPWSSRQGCESSGVKVLVPSVACMPSGQPPLLRANPLRTGRETFASSGSSIPKNIYRICRTPPSQPSSSLRPSVYSKCPTCAASIVSSAGSSGFR